MNFSQPKPHEGASAKLRLLALPSSGGALDQRAQAMAELFDQRSFITLGDYLDEGVGEVPVRAFGSDDRTVTGWVFFLPGHREPVVEFGSAFANGECVVTTTAPIRGEVPAWVDLRALEAAVPAEALAAEHDRRLALAQERVGMDAVRIVDLASHLELRMRAGLVYDLGVAEHGVQAAAGPAAAAVWYYNLAGQRRGPVTFAVLEGLARGGEFNANRDTLWMPDYPEWLRIREIPELAKSLPIEASASSAMAGVGDGDEEVLFEEREERFNEMIISRQDGGFGRIAFLLLSAAIIPAVAYAGQFAAARVLGNAGVAEATALVIMALGLLVAILGRLRNLAMSPAWLLALPVPVLNLWAVYRLVVCPPGYAEHKRLGAGGAVLAVLFWLWIAGFIALLAVSASGKILPENPLFEAIRQNVMRLY